MDEGRYAILGRRSNINSESDLAQGTSVDVDKISLEINIRFARAVRLASATTTSGTYSTSKICLIAEHIRFACISSQKLKSSGSRSSGFAFPSALVTSDNTSVSGAKSTSAGTKASGIWQDKGIKDGSESRQRGTTCKRVSLTKVKVRGSEGLSTEEGGMSQFNERDVLEEETNPHHIFRGGHPCSSRCIFHHGDSEPRYLA